MSRFCVSKAHTIVSFVLLPFSLRLPPPPLRPVNQMLALTQLLLQHQAFLSAAMLHAVAVMTLRASPSALSVL